MKFNEYEYKRPDLDKVVCEIAVKRDQLNHENSMENIKQIIDCVNQMKDHVITMQTLCSIRASINTKDLFYDEEEQWFNENLPQFQNACTLFSKALLNHPFRNELENYYGKQWFSLQELSLKVFDEKIMNDLVTEAKLVTEYEKLLASCEIEFQGKTNNLSQMAVYSSNIDRNIRKEAEMKKAQYFESISGQLDCIYDQLVKVRDSMAKKMGYENYIQFGYDRLGRVGYNFTDIKNYRDLVYQYVVPVAKKIVDQQTKLLGIDSMKFYDLNMTFKDGNPLPRGQKDELVAKANRMYMEMSPNTSEFFNYMMEHDLLDLETKPGKRGGGYTTYINDYHSPFIFSNFNGTSSDIDVLTHEAGHAFEVYEASKNLTISDLYWPTLEACEIHSMSMEFFSYPWMEYFFGRDASKYRYKHLIDAICFIPYGVSVDEFQEYVYKNPSISPKERKDKWREIEKKYTPYKDYDGISFYEQGGYWQRQGHIYSTAFYYIDYTLAQVCAFNFYLLDNKNHEDAWSTYLKLCQLGGSKSFLELLKEIGFDNPLQSDFLKNCMKEIEKMIKTLYKEC